MPFAIDPVCGKVMDPQRPGLEVIANGIAFPFCGEECLHEFENNRLDHLYCPWKPEIRIDPNVSAKVYGKTIYFCCTACRENAMVFVAIQTNGFGFLGVRIRIDQGRARRNLDNFAVVTEVLGDSPAARSGIGKDSVILKIDGKDMNDYRKLIRWMRLSVAAQEAVIEIKAPDGTTTAVKVVLGRRGRGLRGLVY